jgi:serine/threonine protein kinase
VHIVTMYEMFESPQCMWLIMELVEGTGLRGGLAEHGHYTEKVASRYFKQVCMGLHYLHNHGVIHRDVKIDNILINGDPYSGLAKITDFGLSALIRPTQDGYDPHDSAKRKNFRGLHEMWGTPRQYAPELIDRAYGPQADMWSLGCILFEMLTGYEAFPS